MHLRPVVSCLILGLALTGCAAGTVTPLPATPEACQAEFDATKGRIRSTPTYTSGNNAGASFIGAAIGRGIAKGAAESRYNACLAQFQPGGTTAAPSPAPAPTASTAPAASSVPRTASPATTAPYRPRKNGDCRGSVLVGGAGYCIRDGG